MLDKNGYLKIWEWLIHNLKEWIIWNIRSWKRFKLPYIGNKSHIIEKKINELTRKSYNAVNSRIFFISKPVFVPRGKDLIQQKEKKICDIQIWMLLWQ